MQDGWQPSTAPALAYAPLFPAGGHGRLLSARQRQLLDAEGLPPSALDDLLRRWYEGKIRPPPGAPTASDVARFLGRGLSWSREGVFAGRPGGADGNDKDSFADISPGILAAAKAAMKWGTYRRRATSPGGDIEVWVSAGGKGVGAQRVHIP